MKRLIIEEQPNTITVRKSALSLAILAATLSAPALVSERAWANCEEEPVRNLRRRPGQDATNCIPTKPAAPQTKAPTASEQGTGEQGTGEQGTGEQGTVEQSTVEKSTVEKSTVEAAPQKMERPTQRRRSDYVDRTPRTVKRNEPAASAVMPTKTSLIPRPALSDFPNSPPLPDRWRIVDALGYEDNWWDPYHRNTLKADKPIHGDWFFNVGIISDTVYEVRSVPTPVGLQSSLNSGQLDVFGGSDQLQYNQNLAIELVYYKGDTVFRPPDYEFRLIPVLNFNKTELDETLGVNVDPTVGTTRHDNHIGWQAAFVDVHLRNVSDRYDFDSIRVGIQPFNADFRGFLFQDSPFGIRLFGTRDNNIFQYNLAWFRRMDKDTNSGLNDWGKSLREDDLFVFNLFWQDHLKLGLVSQFSVIWNRNRESDSLDYDNNGFIVRPASLGFERPRDYDVLYLGYSADGHIGRLNLNATLWYANGTNKNGLFVQEETDIRAGFLAAEASMDFDWRRIRLSFVYASGDDDPYDNADNGFDAILENPQIAGSDTSYWIRQAVPLIAGGKVAVSGRNGALNSLRSSKDQGQSNFTNPGLLLLGLGADFDLTPQWRISINSNALSFDTTAVLEAARNQGNIDKDIGLDVSLAVIYRPLMSQNIVLRGSYAKLFSGAGFEALYLDEDPDYALFNLILTY